MSHYHVVDWGDKFILFSGTLDECLQVQHSTYAGLFVLSDEEIAELGDDILARNAQILIRGSGTE